MKRLYIIGMLCAVLASCAGSNDDLSPETETSIPILYNAGVRTRTNLETIYTKFAAWSWKTMADGSKQNVMGQYTVEYGAEEVYGSHWYYEGLTGAGGNEQYLKFWDLSARQYVFAAVAPVPGSEADLGYDVETIVDNDGNIRINNIRGNCPSSGPDWMVARTIRRGINDTSKILDYDDIVEDVDNIDNNNGGMSAVFPKPMAPMAEVPLLFHRLLAKVDVVVYADEPLNIVSFRMVISDTTPADNIFNLGDYDTKAEDGWVRREAVTDLPNGQNPKCYGDYTYPDGGKEVSTERESPTMLASHVEIPQTFPDEGRVFTVTLVDDEGNEYLGIIELNEETNITNSWLQNKHYTYVLKITKGGEGSSEVILFEVDMEPWKKGETEEETQTNW